MEYSSARYSRRIFKRVCSATPFSLEKSASTGGSPELITGPDCGTLLPDRRPETVAAACVAVLRNPACRQTAAGNARCNLEARFTWEATTRRFLALAEESTKGTCE